MAYGNMMVINQEMSECHPEPPLQVWDHRGASARGAVTTLITQTSASPLALKSTHAQIMDALQSATALMWKLKVSKQSSMDHLYSTHTCFFLLSM